MSFKDSPLFHFVVGTLWFVTAAVTAIETRTFIGPVYWPPILFSVAGICFYAHGSILLIGKGRNHRKAREQKTNR